MVPRRPYCALRCFAAGTVSVLAMAAVFASPARAQQPMVRMRHLAPQAMSASDRAMLQARHADLIEAAEIYGYNLAAGNWIYRQTLCAPMPHTILLHYIRRFPDGTESLFTALIPRGQGRVRIVPVLYRNATPFVPAPHNPRNYALFNSLVPSNIAAQLLASSRNWIELSACYAEMTGADIQIPGGRSIEAGVAGAPTATIQLDSRHKNSLVTLADRETAATFRVWSISFNHEGRVTAAGTEVYPVNSSGTPPTRTAVAMQSPETESAPIPVSHPAGTRLSAPAPPEPHPSAPSAELSASPPSAAAAVPPAQSEAPAKAVSQSSRNVTTEPGWKFIPQAPQPPAKFIPDAPQPPSKIVPEPPND